MSATKKRVVSTKQRVPSRSRAMVAAERILGAIHRIRDQKVMLAADLANLYSVETRALVQAVERNRSRSPGDLMFQLTTAETAALTSQLVMSKTRGGRRSRPYAFTEQGVAMLSSVLRSTRAVEVNVEMMRAFVRVRELVAGRAEPVRCLDALEERYDRQFGAVLDAIRALVAHEAKPRRRIGFHRAPDDSPV